MTAESQCCSELARATPACPKLLSHTNYNYHSNAAWISPNLHLSQLCHQAAPAEYTLGPPQTNAPKWAPGNLQPIATPAPASLLKLLAHAVCTKDAPPLSHS